MICNGHVNFKEMLVWSSEIMVEQPHKQLILYLPSFRLCNAKYVRGLCHWIFHCTNIWCTNVSCSHVVFNVVRIMKVLISNTFFNAVYIFIFQHKLQNMYIATACHKHLLQWLDDSWPPACFKQLWPCVHIHQTVSSNIPETSHTCSTRI